MLQKFWSPIWLNAAEILQPHLTECCRNSAAPFETTYHRNSSASLVTACPFVTTCHRNSAAPFVTACRRNSAAPIVTTCRRNSAALFVTACRRNSAAPSNIKTEEILSHLKWWYVAEILRLSQKGQTLQSEWIYSLSSLALPKSQLLGWLQ